MAGILREMFWACKAMLNEVLFVPTDRTSVSGCIQSVVKFSPLKRLILMPTDGPNTH